VPDRAPAYISWAQYEANQTQLQANQARATARGAVRSGAALLAGLVSCAHCSGRQRHGPWLQCGPECHAGGQPGRSNVGCCTDRFASCGACRFPNCLVHRAAVPQLGRRQRPGPRTLEPKAQPALGPFQMCGTRKPASNGLEFLQRCPGTQRGARIECRCLAMLSVESLTC